MWNSRVVEASQTKPGRLGARSRRLVSLRKGDETVWRRV